MKMIKPLLSSTLILLALGISNGYAKNNNANNSQAKGSNAQAAAKPDRGGHFHDDEIRIIRDYYHGDQHGPKQKKLPKGLQKKYERTGELPPGWEMKLQRGEVMPIDIYRYGRPLPYDLRQRLPIGPVGSKIIEVEGKIIRVMENTREIIDILDL